MNTKKMVVLLILGILLAIPITFCACCVRWTQMMSSSMEPTIMGVGSPPIREGDFVFYSTWFSKASLRSGDLAIVKFTNAGSGQTVETIRRVTEIVRDSNDISRADPSLKSPMLFRLKADSQRGMDSDNFGLLPEQSIKGKVFYILRSQSLTNAY